MKYIIQHNLINPKSLQAIKDAITPYPHEFVGVIPFSHEIIADEPLVGVEYIPYGSTLMIDLTKNLGWTGCHFNDDTFTYEAAIANRRDMMNGEFIMTVEECVQFMMNGMRSGGDSTEWFIRPSKDLKQFSGQVITAGECRNWLQEAVAVESSTTKQLCADDVVVVATPKPIDAEWRWFVVGGQVIDGSMYRCRGRLQLSHEDDAAIYHEAQAFADQWLPDACCVMDIALVEHELKVIEFNCINGSGFYDHDVTKIFKALWEYHV
jgi:hypothetical protein